MARAYKIEVHRIFGSMNLDHDWCAYDDLTFGGESTDPIGYGRTPRAAIEDFMDQIDEIDVSYEKSACKPTE